MNATEGDVTRVLASLSEGAPGAAEQLVALVYDSLKGIAAQHLQRERTGHTLQPTALVHEAYLRLVDQRSHDWKNRAHFFAVASRLIRRILVDHVRARLTVKRGSNRARVTLDEQVAITAERDLDLLALDEALAQLGRLHERQARVVELRFFGGLDVEEVALALGVSSRTVKGDWRVARAWLSRELHGQDPT